MSRFIAVDPGLHSAGWAVFDRVSLSRGPVAVGLVRSNPRLEGVELLVRAADCGDRLSTIASSFLCTQAFIEFPVFYPGADARGNAIFKLCACAGAIAGTLSANKIKPSEILVPWWKGQLPKEVVKVRIEKILGFGLCQKLALKADMWDAVGIGLYVKGYL